MRLLRSFDLKQKSFVTVVKVIKFPFPVEKRWVLKAAAYVELNPVK